DVGTQYRSGIYYYDDEQRRAAEASRSAYQTTLTAAGYGAITTEILPAPEFYYAEDHHQQYLAKNPDGYCGLGGTGVSCPVGVRAAGMARARRPPDRRHVGDARFRRRGRVLRGLPSGRRAGTATGARPVSRARTLGRRRG